jgi:hypothetical protein
MKSAGQAAQAALESGEHPAAAWPCARTARRQGWTASPPRRGGPSRPAEHPARTSRSGRAATGSAPGTSAAEHRAELAEHSGPPARRRSAARCAGRRSPPGRSGAGRRPRLWPGRTASTSGPASPQAVPQPAQAAAGLSAPGRAGPGHTAGTHQPRARRPRPGSCAGLTPAHQPPDGQRQHDHDQVDGQVDVRRERLEGDELGDGDDEARGEDRRAFRYEAPLDRGRACCRRLWRRRGRLGDGRRPGRRYLGRTRLGHLLPRSLCCLFGVLSGCRMLSGCRLGD